MMTQSRELAHRSCWSCMVVDEIAWKISPLCFAIDHQYEKAKMPPSWRRVAL